MFFPIENFILNIISVVFVDCNFHSTNFFKYDTVMNIVSCARSARDVMALFAPAPMQQKRKHRSVVVRRKWGVAADASARDD